MGFSDESGGRLAGLPLMLAIIGGDPGRFAPFVDLYQRTLEAYARPPLPVGVHSHGYVAATDQQAVDIQWPHWRTSSRPRRGERGRAPPTFDRFQAEIATGSLYVGSPDAVAAKLAATIRTLGLRRFDFVYGLGGVPHEQKLATNELYGREVIPRVRELLATAPETAMRRMATSIASRMQRSARSVDATPPPSRGRDRHHDDALLGPPRRPIGSGIGTRAQLRRLPRHGRGGR